MKKRDFKKFRETKNIKVERIFGKEKNRGYKIRRDIFFIVLVIVIGILWFFLRYFELFNYIYEIPKYIQIVNSVSLLGLAIAIFGFYMLDKIFKIGFKKRHYFFAILMSITAIILSFLYFEYPNFDKIQHFVFPMMIGSIVFFVINKLNIGKKWKLVFTFSVVISILCVFELIEYFLDFLFDWKLQGVFLRDLTGLEKYNMIMSRIDDTMADLLLGISGTLIYVFTILFINKRNN